MFFLSGGRRNILKAMQTCQTNGSLHPPLSLSLLSVKKHREIIPCASAVSQQGKGYLGKNLPPNPPLWTSPYPHHVGFVFWEWHSSGRV